MIASQDITQDSTPRRLDTTRKPTVYDVGGGVYIGSKVDPSPPLLFRQAHRADGRVPGVDAFHCPPRDQGRYPPMRGPRPCYHLRSARSHSIFGAESLLVQHDRQALPASKRRNVQHKTVQILNPLKHASHETPGLAPLPRPQGSRVEATLETLRR